MFWYKVLLIGSVLTLRYIFWYKRYMFEHSVLGEYYKGNVSTCHDERSPTVLQSSNLEF